MKKIILTIVLGLIFNGINAQNIKIINSAMIQNKEELKVITDTIASMISKNYVYPDKGKRISKEFLNWSDIHFTNFPVSYHDYAKEADDILISISDDIHFFVEAPERKESAGSIVASSSWFLGSRKGYGVTKYELLEGNIGYAKYSFFNFTMMPGAKTAIDRMVALLNLSDALIIDLRDNPGGDGGMAEYFFSYFLPEDSLYISSFNFRTSNGKIEYSENFSYKKLPEKRIIDKPVFILVNNGTGSSAEYFSFIAKNQIKAIIIGEQTAGAGHSLTTLKVNDYLTIGVPSGRLYDKNLGKGWEETNGITPNVIVDESLVLEKAHSLALSAIEQAKMHNVDK